MMNGPTIEPQSVAADKETERKVRTFRVLKWVGTDKFGDNELRNVWNELGEYETVWNPDAEEVGGLFGEGDYLLIEKDSRYSFLSTYEMRVVAEKRYRLADEDAWPRN